MEYKTRTRHSLWNQTVNTKVGDNPGGLPSYFSDNRPRKFYIAVNLFSQPWISLIPSQLFLISYSNAFRCLLTVFPVDIRYIFIASPISFNPVASRFWIISLFNINFPDRLSPNPHSSLFFHISIIRQKVPTVVPILRFRMMILYDLLGSDSPAPKKGTALVLPARLTQTYISSSVFKMLFSTLSF